jgi:hypothetical protein
MMMFEMRLKVRIREQLGLPDDNDTSQPCLYYANGRMVLFKEGVDGLARHVLHRMMEQRINEGRKFDSILAASTKAFGHMMMNKLLEDTSQES